MLKKATYILILCCFGLINANAQYNLSSNSAMSEKIAYTISGITVEGNNYASAETIIALTAIYPGQKVTFPLTLDNAIFRTAIQNLWERKEFAEVSIEIDKVISNEIFLVIKVKEWQRLDNIEVANNKKIDAFDIKEKVDRNQGDILSEYDLYLIRKTVENMYIEDGYTLDSLNVELKDSDKPKFSHLNIYVEEGDKFKVKSVQFVGISILKQKELSKAIKENDAPAWWAIWKSRKFLKNKLEEDRKAIEDLCHERGFVDAKVSEPKVVTNIQNKTVDLIYEVFEGERIFVRDIKFSGNIVFTEAALIARLDFKKGDPFDQKKFQSNLFGNEKQNDALSLYMDNGYLRANFSPEESRIGNDSVDIIVRVMESERFKFNKVSITGNEKTKDKVIRRDLYTTPGDYFDRSAIIRSLRQLNVMNYFNPEKLKPEIQPSTTDATTVDLTYNVEERSTDTFNASIGFAGSYGLMGSIGLTFNNFSISEPWKGGGGQILNFNLDFGQSDRYRSFSLGLTEPWLFDKPTTLGFVLFDRYQNYNDINLQSTGATLNFGRRFRWPDDYWRGDWSFRWQWNDNKTGTGYTSYYYKNGKFTEGTIEQRLSRISLNNMFFASQGSKFELRTSFAMGAIGIGQTDYLKNELNFELYNPLMSIKGQDRLVFMMSAKAGYVTGMAVDTMINQLELYRMGGNGLSGFGTIPLRGYPDNQIGSTSGNKVMSKYTAELRFAVSMDPMPIFVYGFAEAGNVWNDLRYTDIFDLKRAAGLGIQLMVQPIGILGFSYGYGFDTYSGSTDPSGWQFLFHLGGQ